MFPCCDGARITLRSTGVTASMATRHIISALLLALPGTLAAQPNCGIPSRVAAAPGDSIVPVERLLAIVGDRYILCSEFFPAYVAALSQQNRTLPDSATMLKEMREMLDGYVDRELLVYIALQQNLDFTPEEIERGTDKEIADYRADPALGGSEEAFLRKLREAGFASMESFRRFIGEQIRRQGLPTKLLDELRRNGKLPSAPAPDSAITARLPERRAALGKKPVRISFRQVFLMTQPTPAAELAAKARADSLLARLQKGEDFEALAKAESDDSLTKDKGGDLDWKRRGDLVPAFERWAFSSGPGQLSPVIRTAFGYHIGKVDRVQAAEVRARHILVRPVIDSADVVRNKALADSIVKQLRAGANFDTLADRHGDVTTKNQRTIPGEPRDGLPPEYAAALKDLKPGDVTDAFQIPDPRSKMPTYVIAVVTAIDPGGEYTDEELREDIRRNLQNAGAVGAYLTKMRKQVYIRIYM